MHRNIYKNQSHTVSNGRSFRCFCNSEYCNKILFSSFSNNPTLFSFIKRDSTPRLMRCQCLNAQLIYSASTIVMCDGISQFMRCQCVNTLPIYVKQKGRRQSSINRPKNGVTLNKIVQIENIDHFIGNFISFSMSCCQIVAVGEKKLQQFF